MSDGVPLSWQTDMMMFALKDDKPVACGWMQLGVEGQKWTNRTHIEWSEKGFQVIYLDKDDPRTKLLHEGVWNQGRLSDTERAVLEAATAAIYDMIMADGDPFAVFLHTSGIIYDDVPMDEQLIQVREICRKLASAALNARAAT